MTDPERIGKYEIRSVLGRGAMGVVYRAFDPQIEREVAIKTVRRDLVDADVAAQFMARFRNEARAAGRLLHPNIVAVYEYGEDGPTAFIAMEFVAGVGLREYLNRKVSLAMPQIASIMAQLLQALHFAHERGVVHRDIKPPNLILTAEGALKVADFGIARIDTSNLTSVGMVVGTPAYMSPEQCRGGDLDRRSDLYSAGVVLYELLTGEPPFRGSMESLMYRICHEDAPAPSTMSRPGVSPAIDAVVARALAKHPDQRFHSAGEFEQSLRRALDAGADADDRTIMAPPAGVPLQPVTVPDWDDAVLGTVERQLAQFVGPMAKVMVRKASTQAHDLADLYARLSENIGTAPERTRFVGGMPGGAGTITAAGLDRTAVAAGTRAASPATGTSHRAAPSIPQVPVDQAFVDAVTGKLAVYVGPIARVLTRKAAQQAAGQHDFVRIVAGHLGVQERGAFLRDVGFTPD